MDYRVGDMVDDSRGNHGTVTMVFGQEIAIKWYNGMTGSFHADYIELNGIRKVSADLDAVPYGC